VESNRRIVAAGGVSVGCRFLVDQVGAALHPVLLGYECSMLAS